MNKLSVNGRTIYAAKFHNENLARQAAARGNEWIVLGDHDDPWGGFWVVRPVDARRLVRAGYEYAAL